ncbi:MAG TPA: hypothetical protein PLZ58_00450 [Candidatus Saccharibacteria bacterium]|nr:hypothetical protein [Candidatus Saccharibacteria bacterium]HRQ07210.1 hypothetical protein [Candidatus Saccharibacteria bacterium]
MEEELEEDDFDINLPKDYLGQAGEYLTAGKLLLNGFNVFHGAIDDGIDIVASKDNRFYKIQVKTCQDIEGYDSGKFMANVNLSTLSKHDVKTTYVVFVVHYLNGQISLDNAGDHNTYDQDFIVLPAQKIFDLVGANNGHAVINIRSSLVTDDHGKDFMYKAIHKGNVLVLDDYLIESFAQIVEDTDEGKV